MSEVIWRRLRYMMTPQWDIYRTLADKLEYKKILEVGFGTGAGVVQYASMANMVIAIETDKEAVSFAEKMWPLIDVFWAYGDITDPPRYVKGAKFDAVLMIEVLEHIENFEAALSNVYNCLDDGGVLYMSARNMNADLRRNDLHYREWTAHELRENLLRFFQDVEIMDVFGNPLPSDTHVTPLIAKALKWKNVDHNGQPASLLFSQEEAPKESPERTSETSAENQS